MMYGAAARAAMISQLAVLALSCAPVQNSVPDTTATTSAGATGLTAEQRAAGWRPLFDGTSTSAWRGYKSQTFPAGWRIVDGVLTKNGSVEDIMTRDQFGNFQLALDWKLSPGGNAGIFYRGTEEYDHIYWSAPEYQLLDDAGHPDGQSRLTSAGADYGLYPSPAGVVKPADQWNSTLIVVNGNTVQHWLNGQKLLEYEVGSSDWEAKVKASKFAAYPNYGRAKRGYIAIQGDHDGALSIRNVRIREIK
jgi:3-keto-disaccharide hydrolase